MDRCPLFTRTLCPQLPFAFSKLLHALGEERVPEAAHVPVACPGGEEGTVTKNWGSAEASAAGDPRAVRALTPLGHASSDQLLDVCPLPLALTGPSSPGSQQAHTLSAAPCWLAAPGTAVTEPLRAPLRGRTTFPQTGVQKLNSGLSPPVSTPELQV